MYKFSAPMPYSKENIDKILDINKQVEKSKITSLYACVPRGCEVFTGFEQSRNFAFDNVSWDYWKGLIEYTLAQGCDFIYLLNSPRPLDIENHDFPKQLEKLEFLLTELRKIGVNKLRIASAQLMSYIGKHYSDFDVLASTSLEYKTIWEYQNFIQFHSEVKQIVPSHDVNKNFLLLKNLRKIYPKMEIELMVNEGCLQGCPDRIVHSFLIEKYTTSFCSIIAEKLPIKSLSISTNIFPWDIKEYTKIGIKNFKLVGRDKYPYNNYHNYYIYLIGIDNFKYIKNYSLNTLTHHLQDIPALKQMNIYKYRKYLPKIDYFKKYGHLCSSRCFYKCRYCYKCADKIYKILKKQSSYVPACTLD